jgi:hypothetical protein
VVSGLISQSIEKAEMFGIGASDGIEGTTFTATF